MTDLTIQQVLQNIEVNYVKAGQKRTMPLSQAVLTIYGEGEQLPAMPASFDIALRRGAANGMKEAVFVTEQVFFASIIEMVNEARADLVKAGQATDASLQAMIDR